MMMTAIHSRRGRLPVVALALALTGAAACSEDAPVTPKTKAEAEPNDALDKTLTDLSGFYDTSRSQTVAAGDAIGGTISGAGGADIDWFVFAPTADGWLDVTLTSSDAGSDLDVNVVETESFFPYGFAYGRTASSSEATRLPVYAGNSYAILVHDFDWSGRDIPYTLTVAFSAGGVDADDNNNAPGKANPTGAVAAASSMVITGTIGYPSDADWFMLDQLDPDLTYQVMLEVPASQAYALVDYVHDPAQPAGMAWTVNNGPMGAPAQGEAQGTGVSYTIDPFYFSVQAALKSRSQVWGNFDEPRFFSPSALYTLTIETSPASPKNVTVDVSTVGEATLSWEVVEGADSYDIFCDSVATVSRDSETAMAVAEGVAATSYTMMNPLGGTQYCVVASANSAGGSYGSAAVTVTTTGVTPLWQENFEAGLPAGWSEVDLSGGTGNQNWSVGVNTDPTSGEPKMAPFEGAAYLWADTYETGEVMDAQMQTAVIAVPAAATTLAFASAVGNPSDIVELLISSDGGTTWIDSGWSPVNYAAWELASVDITSHAGSDIQLAFHYAGDYFYFWHVDSLLIY